jgi:hypothetical protein
MLTGDLLPTVLQQLAASIFGCLQKLIVRSRDLLHIQSKINCTVKHIAGKSTSQCKKEKCFLNVGRSFRVTAS